MSLNEINSRWLPPFIGLALAIAALGGFVLAQSTPTAQGAPPNKPASLDGHIVVSGSSDINSDPVKSARAECPEGTGVIGGGHGFSQSGVQGVIVVESHPIGKMTFQGPGGAGVVNNGWVVRVEAFSTPDPNWGVLAWAACVAISDD